MPDPTAPNKQVVIRVRREGIRTSSYPLIHGVWNIVRNRDEVLTLATRTVFGDGSFLYYLPGGQWGVKPEDVDEIGEDHLDWDPRPETESILEGCLTYFENVLPRAFRTTPKRHAQTTQIEVVRYPPGWIFNAILHWNRNPRRYEIRLYVSNEDTETSFGYLSSSFSEEALRRTLEMRLSVMQAEQVRLSQGIADLTLWLQGNPANPTAWDRIVATRDS